MLAFGVLIDFPSFGDKKSHIAKGKYWFLFREKSGCINIISLTTSIVDVNIRSSRHSY